VVLTNYLSLYQVLGRQANRYRWKDDCYEVDRNIGTNELIHYYYYTTINKFQLIRSYIHYLPRANDLWRIYKVERYGSLYRSHPI